jgi:hypothetical protein
MLLADRRPARIMAQPLIRVQPVSLPGVVQREIDGVLARNHRTPFEDSRTLMPCASSRSRIVRLGCSPSSVPSVIGSCGVLVFRDHYRLVLPPDLPPELAPCGGKSRDEVTSLTLRSD